MHALVAISPYTKYALSSVISLRAHKNNVWCFAFSWNAYFTMTGDKRIHDNRDMTERPIQWATRQHIIFNICHICSQLLNTPLQSDTFLYQDLYQFGYKKNTIAPCPKERY